MDKQNLCCDHDQDVDCNCEHNHDKDCDCGHDHDCENDRVFVTFDDGEDVECNIIGVFEHNGQEYIAINPIETDEVLIYRFAESDQGMELIFIESDDEYNDVAKLFDHFYNENE